MNNNINISKIDETKYQVGKQLFVETISSDGKRNNVVVLSDGYNSFLAFMNILREKFNCILDMSGYDDMTCLIDKNGFKMELNYYWEDDGMVILSAFCQNDEELNEFRMICYALSEVSKQLKEKSNGKRL